MPILLTPVMGALGPLSKPSPSPQRSMSLDDAVVSSKGANNFLSQV